MPRKQSCVLNVATREGRPRPTDPPRGQTADQTAPSIQSLRAALGAAPIF